MPLPLCWCHKPDLIPVQSKVQNFLNANLVRPLLKTFNHLVLLTVWIWLAETEIIEYKHIGLPWWLSGTDSVCQCRRHKFDPLVRKIPWRRKWQPTPVFLPGKSHGQRRLSGYSRWGCKSVRHNLLTEQPLYTWQNKWRNLKKIARKMSGTQSYSVGQDTGSVIYSCLRMVWRWILLTCRYILCCCCCC